MHLAAQSPALEGFLYGDQAAPTGKEWESVEELSLNKEQPHAYFFSFESVESARKFLPENSKYWQSLNGTWKFDGAPHPEVRPKRLGRPGCELPGWDGRAVDHL